MRFSPAALLVLVAFCLMLAFALSGGAGALGVGEAVTTILILAGVGGLAFRGHSRPR